MTARTNAYRITPIERFPDLEWPWTDAEMDAWLASSGKFVSGFCAYCGVDCDNTDDNLAWVCWDAGDEHSDLYHVECLDRDAQAEMDARKDRGEPWTGSDMEYERWLQCDHAVWQECGDGRLQCIGCSWKRAVDALIIHQEVKA